MLSLNYRRINWESYTFMGPNTFNTLNGD
jgi:hypothetical protein